MRGNNEAAFQGRLRFCSNFHRRPVVYKNVRYKTREHAFQAQKFLNADLRQQIIDQTTPGRAKQEAQRLKAHVRADWKNINLRVMQEILEAFFDQWPDMQKRLLGTEGEYIEERNNWGDRFWGTVNGEGENHLGKILMRIRSQLRNKHQDQDRNQDQYQDNVL